MTIPSFFSHAKINLGLQILNKRKDGYHNLHSLFVEVDLSDKLVFTPAKKYYLTAEGEGSDITSSPDERADAIDSKTPSTARPESAFVNPDDSATLEIKSFLFT